MAEIKNIPVNPDLAAEREASILNSYDFALWWAGGSENLEKRRSLEKLFFEDTDFDIPKHYAHMSHSDYYDHQLKLNTKFIKKFREWFERDQHSKFDPLKHIDIECFSSWRTYNSGHLGMAIFAQKQPLSLHYSMFLHAIFSNASEEQHQHWLPKAWNMDGWVGTYAQTELGHGTYLRGLETKAEYDMRKHQFIINTPTLTAHKWWPGSLGNCANIAVIAAKLFINGKPCGLQQFLVPLRDEKTHEPLQGVDIGEIGPKVGMNGANNGFLGLTNVRIPRTNMLMKHAQVLPSGKFIMSPQPLLLYGTMMYIRVGIVSDCALYLQLASTIATRYSLVRRQSPIAVNGSEAKILDHVTQQGKVLPNLAKGIAFQMFANKLWKSYCTLTEQLKGGEHKLLSEMHALSCVLKAICTEEAERGVEILRKSCGGHGFLSSANFGQIYGAATAACTYEGENTVLLLQTARFLMKIMSQQDKLNQHDLPQSVQYLSLIHKNEPTIILEQTGISLMENLVLIMAYTTGALVQYAHVKQQEKNKVFGAELGANMAGVTLLKAAVAHGHCYMVHLALEEAKKLHTLNISTILIDVISQLLELYVIDTVYLHLADVLRFTRRMTAAEISYIERRFEKLMALIRPNAIAVVDGFDFNDRTLASTLGAWDGRAYERLMEEARKNPLNQQSVQPVFYTHLKPLIEGKL